MSILTPKSSDLTADDSLAQASAWLLQRKAEAFHEAAASSEAQLWLLHSIAASLREIAKRK